METTIVSFLWCVIYVITFNIIAKRYKEVEKQIIKVTQIHEQIICCMFELRESIRDKK